MDRALLYAVCFCLCFSSLHVALAQYAKVVSLYGNITGENDKYKDLMTDAENYLNNDGHFSRPRQFEIQVIHKKSVGDTEYDDMNMYQSIKIACNDVNSKDAIALILANDLCPDCKHLSGAVGDAYSPVLALDQADDTRAFKMRPSLKDIEEMVTGVIDNFKWTTFIFLHEGDSGRTLMERMMSNATNHNWTISPVEIGDDFEALMEKLRIHKMKNIVVYLTEETLLKPLFKTAFGTDLLSTGWHWMFANLNPPISKAFLEQKYRHSMAWLTRFKVDAMEHKYYTSNQEPIKKWPFRMRAAYDAIVAVAEALSRYQQRTGRLPRSIESCGTNVRSELEEDLRQINFHGASGMVAFDSNGDRVNYTVKIYSGKDRWAENEIGFFAQDPKSWEQAKGDWPGTPGSRLYIKPFRQADSEAIKVVAVPEPPFFMQRNWEKIRYDETPMEIEGPYTGMAFELLKEIKKVMEEELNLDFNYEITLLNRGDYGTLDLSSGKWDGMVRDLEDGKADIAIGSFVRNGPRESVIDFTEHWYKGNIKLLMLHPSWSFEYPFAFIFPFHWDAWVGLLVFSSLTSVAIFFLAHFSPYEWRHRALRGEASEEEGRTFSFLNSIFFVLSTGFWMGFQRGPKSWSVRLLSLFWFLFAVSSIFIYAAMLNKVFKFSKTALNVKDEHDLLYQDQFEFGVVDRSPAYDYFRYSDNYYPKKIFNRMITSEDEDLLETRIENAVYRIRRQWDARYTILGDELILKTAGDRKPCRLFVTGHSLGEIKYSLGVTSGSPLRDQLSHVILLLKERGVLDRIKNMEFSKNLRCFNDSIWERQSKKSITVHDMQGPYYMLAIGIACSFVIFAIEFVVFYVFLENKWKPSIPGKSGKSGQTRLDGVNDEFGDFYESGGGRGKGASAPPVTLTNKSTEWI